jgi:uncharacterized sulfatase
MDRPNFVLIMTDTQATNVVGTYGRPELRTPNIDGLARTGIQFNNAYTTCPLCTPARAGLFTGIYSHTSGAWTNNLPLGDNIRTMGQRFRDSGYRSGYVGKWHLDGHDYYGTGICPDGWEEAYWYDGRRYLDELSEEEIRLWRNGLSTYEDLCAHNIGAAFTWAHRVSDRAIDFLRTCGDEPFLLVVSYDEPHHPFTCPPQFVEPFLEYEYDVGPAAFDTLEDKPAHQREWAASQRARPYPHFRANPLYFGCNSFVDHEIGRVIDATHALWPENTYLIFTSDHGDMLGAHGLRGKGAAMYNEIARIPFIVEQPGQLGAGRVSQTPVSHIDLLPTMLELAGQLAVPILEGDSLVGLLGGDGDDLNREVAIEFNRYEIEHDSFGGFQPVRCLVGDRYKLVINLLHTDELYDQVKDPAEMVNLIDEPDYAEVRDAMHDRLLDWMYQKRDPFRGASWERRPWRRARRLQWRGKFRPRPADGYAPQVLDYNTGLPDTGVRDN